MGLFRYLFSKFKHEVFTTFDEASYYRSVSHLQAQGIAYQTDIKRQVNARAFVGSTPTQYLIYVQDKDKQQALQAIADSRR
ncbi:hypothetical protein [Amphibacillus cookii]|uniref:hypothetical protein n=1 Tax=Amphibacillus cookii TaxID=767787 RepID=UPI00195EEC7D|nr:hypothetical protein [Amphibacillus cookii]MBM7542662.1 hypothetical protein [Amphibacillus cookii]